MTRILKIIVFCEEKKYVRVPVLQQLENNFIEFTSNYFSSNMTKTPFNIFENKLDIHI